MAALILPACRPGPARTARAAVVDAAAGWGSAGQGEPALTVAWIASTETMRKCANLAYIIRRVGTALPASSSVEMVLATDSPDRATAQWARRNRLGVTLTLVDGRFPFDSIIALVMVGDRPVTEWAFAVRDAASVPESEQVAAMIRTTLAMTERLQ